MSKDKKKSKGLPRPDTTEIAVAQLSDRYSTHPSGGLTPKKLAEIFHEADDGDVMRQMELFEDMEEKDPHLFSQLQTRKNAVTGLDFEILPFSTGNRMDKTICEFVREQFDAIENMESVMTDLLDAIGKGISVMEILWETVGSTTQIKDILHRHQKMFFWDSEDSFKARTKDAPQGILLPQNKFIIHRYKARSGHPSRAGILRVVAWMYLFKNYDVKDWVSFAEIFGIPLRLGKYSPGASEKEKAALMKALVQIASDAAGIIPEGTSIEFITTEKTGSTDLYERLARYCDEQVSKAVLGQTLTSDSGGGSFAQSKTHNEVRHDLTVADCKALAATLRRDLIRPLVIYNFGESKRIPYLRFDCEEAGDLQQAATILDTLVGKVGLKVPTSHIYKKFSIPKPEADEETAVPPSRPASVSPPQEVSYKLKREAPDDDSQIQTNPQIRADQLADAALTASTGVFDTLFAPVLEALDKAENLEQMKEWLKDEAFTGKLLGRMDTGTLEALLVQAMTLADMEGRAAENG